MEKMIGIINPGTQMLHPTLITQNKGSWRNF